MVINESISDSGTGERVTWYYQPKAKFKDFTATPSDDSPHEWKWEKPK